MSVAKDLELESNEWDDDIVFPPGDLYSDELPCETDLHFILSICLYCPRINSTTAKIAMTVKIEMPTDITPATHRSDRDTALTVPLRRSHPAFTVPVPVDYFQL